MPHICTPPYVHTPPYNCTPPYAPYSSVHLYVFGGFACCGGCNGLPFVLGHLLTLPLLGCLPFNYTPTLSHWFPVHQYVFRDISMLCGHFPSVEEFGVFPHQLGGWGHQHLRCPYAHSCPFFIVHYVSHFDYGSDYYSSSYGGIFWPVISDSGSFSDRVSSKLGSAWHGLTTTLDAERLWRCSWLSFCATAANSIFNASSSLCQLCYGFSTGRFLFQS